MFIAETSKILIFDEKEICMTKRNKKIDQTDFNKYLYGPGFISPVVISC